MTTLQEIVQQRPYPDYLPWWPMGETFLTFMARAITPAWRDAWSPKPEEAGLARVQALLEEYLSTVYQTPARAGMAADFAAEKNLGGIRSGEFDGLSYAFFRSAYERLAEKTAGADALAVARRGFAQAVGRAFYAQLHAHLALKLPANLAWSQDLAQLQQALDRVGRFLVEQGYLRDHFAFRFDVDAQRRGRPIHQRATEVPTRLAAGEPVYALYEMGYPAILPSAVYLYHTLGEAQHHSSRTMEELFARMGYTAHETDDFDPIGFPSELVVELWEIRRR